MVGRDCKKKRQQQGLLSPRRKRGCKERCRDRQRKTEGQEAIVEHPEDGGGPLLPDVKRPHHDCSLLER